MQGIALLLACLACAGQGRRVQPSIKEFTMKMNDTAPIPQSLAQVQQASGQSSSSGAENLWTNKEYAASYFKKKAEEHAGELKHAAELVEEHEDLVEDLVEDVVKKERGKAHWLVDKLHKLRDLLHVLKDVQRVLMLLCMIAIGKILQGRFPDAESNAIQKMLLQFLVPATLFKGLSKEKIEARHLAYIAGGVGMVLARFVSAAAASYAVLGSGGKERSTMRRTAMFEISTMASALSVLPFLGEFVGPEYVGLGGMVDLPMKLYMLIFMPVLLKQMGESSGTAAAGDSKGKAMAILTQLVKDPITMSLVLGIVTAMVTEGGGTAVFGFAGKALDALAGAQTPVLFLLIGLKLKLQSKTPLFCVVLLFAAQGVLLIIVWVVVLILRPSDTIAKFIILFSQGAPSVVGMGVIAAAAGSGVQGYSKDFAFDIVGLAFPISSFMQCFAGIMGGTYQSIVGIVGIVLIAIAGGLRVIFAGNFKEA